MILVDTSVWIDHLEDGNEALGQLLDADAVVTHPGVIGELACGRYQARSTILGLLRRLPQSMGARHDDVLTMIETHQLMGRGLGWIVRHQPHARHAEIGEDLRPDAIVAQVGRETETPVGLHRVHAGVLQGVGP